MKKINSIDNIPSWYDKSKYDLLYKNMDLYDLYSNITTRLWLFRPKESMVESSYNLSFDEFYDSEDSIFKYLEPSDDYFDFYNPTVYKKSFKEVTDNAIIISDKKERDFFCDDLRRPALLGMTRKKLHLPGLHPLAYWEVNKEVERINYIIENKPEFLGYTRSVNDKKINNSEVEIVKLARKIEPEYGDEFFHSYDLNILDEIEELTKTNRNFIHDYLFTINPPDNEKIVDIRIDLTESNNTLKDSFEKLVVSLRKELNIENRKDSILVNKKAKLEHSNTLINKFVNYRVFEFFDLTFWATLSNKRYTRSTMADILFCDKQNDCIKTLLDKTMELIKENFNFQGDGLKSIESQAKASLKYRSFSSKSK